MKARLPVSGGMALALIALAFGTALGQPSPERPPHAGLDAPSLIINCPPPPARGGGSDC